MIGRGGIGVSVNESRRICAADRLEQRQLVRARGKVSKEDQQLWIR